MFSGLVEACVPITSLERRGSGARLVLPLPAESAGDPWEPQLGESISVSGCCLSVVTHEAGELTFDLSAETLAKTWLGEAEAGRVVNLERSVRLADRLGGHLVSGHVDAVGRVARVEDPGDGGRLFVFEVPEGFERWLLDKGSVTVDGISLTVVDPSGREFAVAVIPETLARTCLGSAEAGQAVHLEGDMIGKWVERLVSEGRG